MHFRRLKLEEYASLRAELAVWPEQVGEILRRFNVLSEAARRARRVGPTGVGEQGMQARVLQQQIAKVAKAKATRAARHTLGPKQRKAIKGKLPPAPSPAPPPAPKESA